MTLAPQDLPLPRLREDLQVLRGGLSFAGAPSWIVLDPVRNRFFSISFEMFQLLSLWSRNRSVKELVAAVKTSYGREAEFEEIDAALRMLDSNFFFNAPISGSWRDLYERSSKRQPWYLRVVHNYLFFKIPLVRPQLFIRATWPFVSLLFSRGFLAFVATIGLIGLYLVSRQWDAFVTAFPYVFSFEGILVSAVSVAFIKSLHELGHAYVAHRYGCQIPTMGLAFMVMVPMLYTDVTDAWRLKSRHSRFLIDAAGVMTELCIAAIALFLWVFLPDGPIRSAAFVIATAGWLLSLLVNLNPFTRFDGYYMLADILGLANLQPRAFAHLRWRIRRLLFGLDDDPPEPFPRRLDAFVTLYAICTTVYRLLLYLGIALLVYHFTIKIIGVLLFVVEIGFFIVRPLWSELKQWWQMRAQIIRQKRTCLTLLVIAGAILAVSLPLSTNVRAPALLMPQTFVRIYPSDAGRIEEIKVAGGQSVRQGDILFRLASPELAEESKLTKAKIELAERRLARVGADAADLSDRGVIESERNSLLAKLHGLQERQAKLSIRAPISGRIHDLNSEIFTGRWISRREALAFLSSEVGVVARGYVSDDDHARIPIGARGVFIPDDLTRPKLDATLASIAASAADRLTIPQLTSLHGGPIAATAAHDGGLVPDAAQHMLTAVLDDAPQQLTQTVPGVLFLQGEAQSLLARAWRQVLKVLIRESGL